MQLRGIIVLFLASALAFAGVATTNRALRTESAPLGVLSLQFAGSPARAGEVVASWDATARILAAFNIGLDYLFLVSYSLLLALLCSLVAGRRAMVDPRRGGLGRLLSRGMLLAGLLDSVENWASISLLLEPGRTGLGTWITAFASAKFVLIVLGVSYIAVGTIAFAVRKRAGQTGSVPGDAASSITGHFGPSGRWPWRSHLEGVWHPISGRYSSCAGQWRPLVGV